MQIYKKSESLHFLIEYFVFFLRKYSSFASSEVKGVITPYGRSGS